MLEGDTQGLTTEQLKQKLEKLTSDASTESLKNSTPKYFSDKEDIVRSVRKKLKNLAVGSQLTITIEREKYADYYVTDVINSESGDTQTQATSEA